MLAPTLHQRRVGLVKSHETFRPCLLINREHEGARVRHRIFGLNQYYFFLAGLGGKATLSKMRLQYTKKVYPDVPFLGHTYDPQRSPQAAESGWNLSLLATRIISKYY